MSNRAKKRANQGGAAPLAQPQNAVPIQHHMANVALFAPPPQAQLAPAVDPSLADNAEMEPAEDQPRGGFMFAGKRFQMPKEALADKLRTNKKTKKRYAQNAGLSEAAVDRIFANSKNPEPQENHSSYKAMLETAMLAEIKARAANRAPAEAPPQQVQQGQDQPDLETALAFSPAKKIERLKLLQRRASTVAEEQTLPMRAAAEKVKRYQHRDDPKQDFTVAGHGHFLLGGSADHSYEKMLTEIKLAKGMSDQEAAAYLMKALDGDVIKGPEDDLARKFVSVVHTSEFARSAINPVAMRAGLARVVRDGGDIFDTLHDNVLHVAAEQKATKSTPKKDGGSKRSQHHREEVDEQDADFQRIAAGQHDSIARMAADAGYDPSKPEKLEAFVDASAQSMTQNRIRIFGEAAKEPVVDKPKSGKKKAGKKADASAKPKPKAVSSPPPQDEESSDDGGPKGMDLN